MKYIKGQYYSVDFSIEKPGDRFGKFVWLCNGNDTRNYSYRILDRGNGGRNNRDCFQKNQTHYWQISKLATPEEIHWLNTCISNDTFIEYEEAMISYCKSINLDSELKQILIKLLT